MLAHLYEGAASRNGPQWEITKFSFITCDPATAGGKSGSLLSQLLMRSPSMSLLFEHENYSQLRKKRNEKDSQYKPHAWSSVSYLQSWGLNCSYALDLSRAAVRKPCYLHGLLALQPHSSVKRSTWPSLTASVRSLKSVPWCCPTHYRALDSLAYLLTRCLPPCLQIYRDAKRKLCF